MAWALTSLSDPLRRKKFAGTATELETVADWVKAEEEIEKKSRGSAPLDRRVAEDGGPSEEAGQSKQASVAAKRRAAAKKKKKKKKADDA